MREVMYIVDINMGTRELKHVREEGKRSQLFAESFRLGMRLWAHSLLDLSLCGSYVRKLTVSVSCIWTLAHFCLDDVVSLKLWLAQSFFSPI